MLFEETYVAYIPLVKVVLSGNKLKDVGTY